MITFPIFSKLGGEDRAVAVLRTRRAFTPYAVRKWKTFRRLPSWAQLALTQEAIRRNVKIAPSDFEVSDA